MVVVKLMGGLGNQMFQFAFGLAVAKERNEKMFLDISSLVNKELEGNNPRDYELGIFTYHVQKTNILRSKYQIFFLKLLKKMNFSFLLSHIIEGKNVELLKEKQCVTYLEGYWQSEDYFKKYEPEIKKCFEFRPNSSEENKTLLNKISSKNSVSIHVRRGDYVSDYQTNQFHGVSSMEYYEQAIIYLKKKLIKPFFFVFSDDPEWVLQNFNLDKNESEIVDFNFGNKSFEDLRLMKSCEHNIIANSSFSWWGAWLNSNPQKIVIAPKKWFANSIKESQSQNIVPKEWKRI